MAERWLRSRFEGASHDSQIHVSTEFYLFPIVLAAAICLSMTSFMMRRTKRFITILRDKDIQWRTNS